MSMTKPFQHIIRGVALYRVVHQGLEISTINKFNDFFLLNFNPNLAARASRGIGRGQTTRDTNITSGDAVMDAQLYNITNGRGQFRSEYIGEYNSFKGIYKLVYQTTGSRPLTIISGAVNYGIEGYE